MKNDYKEIFTSSSVYSVNDLRLYVIQKELFLGYNL
jgi:hypothetical protein